MIPVGQNTFNSVFTTIMGTVTSLFFCALAGFALQSINSRKDSFILFCNCYHAGTAGSWFCTTVHHHEKVGLINSLWSLVIPRIATAVGIFYMNQYITDVPDELVEAARIDGCTDFGIFMKIILPVIAYGFLGCDHTDRKME